MVACYALEQCSEPSRGPTVDGGDNAKRTGRVAQDGTAGRSPVRAKYWEDGRARRDGRALHARPFLVSYSETHVISATYPDGRGDGRTA